MMRQKPRSPDQIGTRMSDDTLSSVHLLKIYEYCGLNVTTPRLMLILKNSKRHPP
jgi:hypothetical protein